MKKHTKAPASVPKSSGSPKASIDRDRPTWHVRSADREGDWSFFNATADDLRKVFDRLASFETMTWGTVKDQVTSCHAIAVDRLGKAARERLAAIRQDDVDELFELRIDKAGRVFGILDGPTLRLLWWDAEHQVYPMDITGNSPAIRAQKRR